MAALWNGLKKAFALPERGSHAALEWGSKSGSVVATKTLFDWSNVNTEEAAEALARQWLITSDSQYGGFTRSSIELAPVAEGAENGSEFVWSGETSLRGNMDTELRRAGFAAIRTRKFQPTLNLSEWDALRFKLTTAPPKDSPSDSVGGRRFIVNLQPDGRGKEELWQAFLAPVDEESGTIDVPLARFMATWRGRVVPEQPELRTGKLRSLGLILVDGEEGGFKLGLKGIDVVRWTEKDRYEYEDRVDSLLNAPSDPDEGKLEGDAPIELPAGQRWKVGI